MDLGMHVNLSQKLEQTLSPQMIQSLKLLQVNTLELETLIQQEMEINPVLEMEEPEDARPEEREEALEEGAELKDEENIDWDSYINDGFDLGGRVSDMNAPGEDSFERTPVYASSLSDFLMDQLAERDIRSELRDLVEYLIYSLNNDGWLALPEDAPEVPMAENEEYQEAEDFIAGKLDLFELSPKLRDAVHVLQTMEPPGIGARNLKECLIIQAHRTDFDSPLAIRILEEAFDKFEKVQVTALAKQFEVSAAEIQEALGEIAHLDPHPGLRYGAGEAQAVYPDIVVDRIDGELVMYLNDKNVPRLYISQSYAEMLRKGSNAQTEEKKFIREKLNSANWLIRSIDQRRSTITKVMTAIMERQRDFFEKGPSHIKPMILQDIADAIEMHISTVNRVTNGKFVQTETGIYELKYFFSSAVKQDNDMDLSATQAKEAIRKLVEAEDPKKPLSDQKIADALKADGMKVARRTVAKYREAINILPARLRKKH